MDQPDAQETGGLYFPLLISNLCRFLLVPLNTHLNFFSRRRVHPTSLFDRSFLSR